ncbi:MAG: FGGY family carbohydrate kinase [Eubacteriales bacterium]|nr:FGGY family carbohydrate kinase [Eubacteriales bacterium]
MIHKPTSHNQYLIGLDLGTSAVKGVIMQSDGNIIARSKAKTEYNMMPGVVIQFDAEKFYENVVKVIRELVNAMPKDGTVEALSMASASGNTLLTDDYGKPLYPAISWMDKRVTDEMDKVLGKMDPADVHRIVGWPLSKQFPLAHLSWIKYHRPDLLKNASKVCMTTDYINFRLTGNLGIDQSTATTFYLQEQESSKWYLPYLKSLGLTSQMLPPIFSTGTVLGGITYDAANDTCLQTGTPVVLGAFDHPCAARGSGVLNEDEILLSCGTSWVGFLPVKNRNFALNQKMLIDPFLRAENIWGAMFSLSAVALRVDEYICRFISDSSDRYSEFDKLAANAVPGAGGLIIDPYADPDDFISGHHSKHEIARAIMEGVAFHLRHRIDSLKSDGLKISSITMVGGPSESYPWPQIVCDVLGMELSVVNGSCAGAAGAAIIAGIGVGIYADERDAVKKTSFNKNILTPDKNLEVLYTDRYRDFQTRVNLSSRNL